MMKAIAGTASLLLVASSLSGAHGQGWSHFTSKDEMTGEIQAFATSPRTASTRRMAFPYAEVRGFLGFGCDGKNEWAYIGFTEAPNLTNIEPQVGGYSTFRARVRWDDDLRTMRMSQKWGDRFLHFQDDAAAIGKIAAAQTVLIELKWYGAGDAYFRFTLNGSSEAIARARETCRSE